MKPNSFEQKQIVFIWGLMLNHLMNVLTQIIR